MCCLKNRSKEFRRIKKTRDKPEEKQANTCTSSSTASMSMPSGLTTALETPDIPPGNIIL